MISDPKGMCLCVLRRWEEDPGRLCTVCEFRAANAQGAEIAGAARKRLEPHEIAWNRAKTQQAAQKYPRADIAGRARSDGYRTAPSRMAAALISTATPVS